MRFGLEPVPWNRLHAAVSVELIDSDTVTLSDNRTGFAIELSGFDRGLDFQDIKDVRLTETLATAGMLDGPSSFGELLRKQAAFKRGLANDDGAERLAERLSYLRSAVPFYEQRSEEYDLSRAGGLEGLPLLRKLELRRSFEQFLPAGLPLAEGLEAGWLEFASTSGTTDERIAAISDMRLSRVPSAYRAFWNLEDDLPNGRTGVLTTPVCSSTACSVTSRNRGDRLTHGSVLFFRSLPDPFRATRDDVREFIDELGEFAPAVLLGNPVYLHWYARRAEEFGLDVPSVPLILSSYQFMATVQARRITDLYGGPVYNTYTATELGGCQIAVQCAAGHWHVRADHCLIEFLRGGHAAEAGELAAIVVTTLAGEVFPLVRYAVGDLGSRSLVLIDCMHSEWPTIEFHGRMKDVLKFGNKIISTVDLDHVVSKVAGIEFYQCFQIDDTHMVIDVIPALGFSFSRRALASGVREASGAEQVEVREVQALSLEASMKICHTKGGPDVTAVFLGQPH